MIGGRRRDDRGGGGKGNGREREEFSRFSTQRQTTTQTKLKNTNFLVEDAKSTYVPTTIRGCLGGVGRANNTWVSVRLDGDEPLILFDMIVPLHGCDSVREKRNRKSVTWSFSIQEMEKANLAVSS